MKVQRPGIREQVREDMEVLADLAGFLDKHTETGRRFGLAQLLEEFRKALVDELDYRREADNLPGCATWSSDHDSIVVPEPFPDLTTSKVLTMEFIDGRKVTDLGPLAPARAGRCAAGRPALRGLPRPGPRPGRLPRRPPPRQRADDTGRSAGAARHRDDRAARSRSPRQAGQALPRAGRRPPEEVTRIAVTLGEQLPDFDEPVLRRDGRRPRRPLGGRRCPSSTSVPSCSS